MNHARSRCALALATFACGALSVNLAHAQPRPRWTGPVAFDRDASGLLRARERDVRRVADSASWVIVGVVMAAPLAITTRAAIETRSSALVMGESLLSLAIPYGATAALGFAAKYAIARERPFATREGLARRCVRGDEPGCEWDRNGSFPSLHSALGFAGAGMACVQTLRFAPSNAGLDAVTCGLSTMGAAIGATLRMVADRHYATDVLVGSLLGLGLSVGLGWALHHSDDARLPLASALRGSSTGEPLPVVLGGIGGVLGGALLVTALSAQWR